MRNFSQDLNTYGKFVNMYLWNYNYFVVSTDQFSKQLLSKLRQIICTINTQIDL